MTILYKTLTASILDLLDRSGVRFLLKSFIDTTVSILDFFVGSSIG
jgi:hypothetical protein